MSVRDYVGLGEGERIPVVTFIGILGLAALGYWGGKALGGEWVGVLVGMVTLTACLLGYALTREQSDRADSAED